MKKKIAIAFIVLVLAIVGSLGVSENTFAEHGEGYIEVEEIIGDDLPDDLLINIKGNYADDVHNGLLGFYFGSSEKVDEYWEDYKRVMAEYSSCNNEDVTPEDERDACKEKAEIKIAEACMKYGLFVQLQAIEDIYLTSGGELYPYEDGSITINLHLPDYDELYESILEGMDKYGYSNLKIEPLVIHKKHDDTYERVKADFDVDTNSLRFTVNELSTFMITYAFSTVDDDSENPKTIDNTNVSVVVAAISAAGLFALGVWMTKKERR